MIEALRREILETRLSLHRYVCESLELEYEFAATDEARNILARRWVAERNACYVLQFALDLLKRQQAKDSWNQ
jgi:hypothetical protein